MQLPPSSLAPAQGGGSAVNVSKKLVKNVGNTGHVEKAEYKGGVEMEQGI